MLCFSEVIFCFLLLQLFFTNVKDGHWAVVVANLMHKQFNVFDLRGDDLTMSASLRSHVAIWYGRYTSFLSLFSFFLHIKIDVVVPIIEHPTV